jgi:hypothetical protein
MYYTEKSILKHGVRSMRVADYVILTAINLLIAAVIYIYLNDRKNDKRAALVHSFNLMTLDELSRWVEEALKDPNRDKKAWEPAIRHGAWLYRQEKDLLVREHFRMLINATAEAWVVDHLICSDKTVHSIEPVQKRISLAS